MVFWLIGLPGSQAHPRGLDVLIQSYYRSPGFLGLEASTRRAYRSLIEPLRAKHKHRVAAEMKPEHVMKLLAEKAETPSAASLPAAACAG